MLIQDLKIIVMVARTRSITEAATKLDMHTATASAAIKRVEKQLGMELFIRSTRQLRLSPAGERYIPQCQQAIALLDGAQQHVNSDLGIVTGEVCISVSSDLGRNLVIPWLDDFISEHQDVSLKMIVTDTNIDFYRDDIDIAIRYGAPQDASLLGFKICDVPRFICASPAYLQQGNPKHPQQLQSMEGLFYQISGKVHDVWTFLSDGKPLKVKVPGRRASNDGDLVRKWCVAGYGVASKSGLDIADDLLAGDLVPILMDYALPTSELWMVYSSRQAITPAVRLIRDLLRHKTARLLQQLTAAGLLEQGKL